MTDDSPQVSVLLFTDKKGLWESVDGFFVKPDKSPITVWYNLDDVLQVCKKRDILAFDVVEFEANGIEICCPSATTGEVEKLPLSALKNRNPDLKVKSVLAGGGLVIRDELGSTEVLMILRNGGWDLPKGHAEKGESIEETAIREVQEEVGIKELEIIRPAGVTIHGYPLKGRYCAKKTTWFFMKTPDSHFTPQTEEGIKEVTWMPWDLAVQKVEYASLRRLLVRIQP